HRVILTDGTVRWISGTGRVLLDADGTPTAMVGAAHDITVRKLAEERLEFLARAGALLGSSLDLDTTLQQLCNLAVEQLSDWCSVDLVEADGVRLVAVSHRDPQMVAYARELRERFGVDMDAERGLPVVLRTGRPEVLPEIDETLIRAALAEIPDVSPHDVDQFVALGLRSSMSVPLATSSGQVLGALTLVSAESGRVYGDSDVQLAMEIARRAGVAVEHARLYARAEHAARTLQQSLLPPVLPPLPFADLASYYAPLGRDAELIGGDFYDVFPVSDSAWCLVIGDVSGKGVDAGALTAATRWTFRSAMSRCGEPGSAIRELNESLLQQQWDSRFVTVLAVVAEATADGVLLRYASGGHPAPIVFRGDAATEALPVEGQIVGVLPSVDAPTWETHLAPGDALVLYTDGFTEARRGHELLGEEGLLAALDAVPVGAGADELVKSLVSAVAAFGKQADDMALLVLALPLR
ncbi:MAG: hypothetical protein QOC98_1695, partial [Frankiaceae bacterium]|nr:hypothetical protein [Frankiaceae bacterium]